MNGAQLDGRMGLLVRVGMLIFACLPIPEASGEGFLERHFPVTTLAAVSGNGGLTVGADITGGIAAVSWPSPGYHEQTGATCPRRFGQDVAPARRGCLWAVRLGQRTTWLTEAPWRLASQKWPEPGIPIVEARFALDHASAAEAVQTWFVHPVLDVLAVRLDLHGMAEPFDLFWFQRLEPCARLLPELPPAGAVFPALRGFAAFVDANGARLGHFRPHDPGGAAWAQAEELAARGASAGEWSRFDEGVWAGTASANPVIAFHVGRAGTPDAAAQGIEAGRLARGRAATGQADAAWQLETLHTGEVFSAVVFMALGKNWAAVEENLHAATERGFDVLRQETEQHWRERIAVARAALADPEARNALATILVCADRATGAVPRAPASGTPFAVTTPRQAAWVSLALNMAGSPEDAGRLIAFLADTQRRTSRIGAPLGSLPVAIYASGDEATPRAILQVETASWLLGALWVHAGFMAQTTAQLFLAEHWETVENAADWLAAWVLDGEVTRFLSFDPEYLRERQSVRTLLHVYTGLSAAIRIGEALNAPKADEWTARRRELKSRIQFHLLNATEPIALDAEFPYWMRYIVPPEPEARWDVWDAVAAFDGVGRRLEDAAAPQHAFSQLAQSDRSDRSDRSDESKTGEPSGKPDSLRQAFRLIVILKEREIVQLQ